MTRRRLAFRTRDDEGSMMLFILVLVVVGALTAVSMATLVRGQKVARHDQAFTGALPGADQSIQLAVQRLNAGRAASLPTAPASVSANGCPTAVGWYATKVSTLQYAVWSTNIVNGVTRCVHGIITQGARFPLAAFADANVTFRGNNHANSYNHLYPGATSTDGDVGSNGDVTFNGNASADGVELFNYAAYNNAGRCSGSPCSNVATVNAKEDITSGYATQFINAGLASGGANCPASPTAWVASAHAYSLPSGVSCWSSLTFDGTSTAAGSVSSTCDPNDPGYQPTIVYVTGNVSMANHINVNWNGSSTPNACSLQIYSLGQQVAIGNHTTVAGVIWAPFATCAGNPSNAQADIYGAVVCGSIGNQGGWGFHYDDALGGLGDGYWDLGHYSEG